MWEPGKNSLKKIKNEQKKKMKKFAAQNENIPRKLSGLENLNLQASRRVRVLKIKRCQSADMPM